MCQHVGGTPAGSAAQGWRVRRPSHPDSLGITPAVCGPPVDCARGLRAVAARHGINEKTVRRRRDRVLRSLVSAREVYLRECA